MTAVHGKCMFYNRLCAIRLFSAIRIGTVVRRLQ